MPAFTSVTLADAVPVSRVFTPVSLVGNLARLENVAGGVMDLNDSLTLSIQRPSATSKITKVRIKLITPIASTVVGLENTPAYTLSADLTVMIPPMSTTASRSDLLAMLAGLMLDSTVDSLVTVNDSIY